MTQTDIFLTFLDLDHETWESRFYCQEIPRGSLWLHHLHSTSVLFFNLWISYFLRCSSMYFKVYLFNFIQNFSEFLEKVFSGICSQSYCCKQNLLLFIPMECYPILMISIINSMLIILNPKSVSSDLNSQLLSISHKHLLIWTSNLNISAAVKAQDVQSKIYLLPQIDSPINLCYFIILTSLHYS